MDKYIVIFDGHNITSTSLKNKLLNKKKENIGGVNRFLEKLGFLNNMYSINKVIITFDTTNSKDKRLLLYKDYKGHRKTTDEYKINRETNMNKIKDYSKYLPIYYVEADDCEADDVITYLASDLYKDHKVIIVSTDQDYYQLLNSNTIIFNPSTNKIVDSSSIDYHPKNLILMKAIIGDSSDNIKGVKGIGYKTLKTNIPELFESREINMISLKRICESRIKKSNVFQKLLDHMDNTIHVYCKIINLHDNDMFISEKEKNRIKDILEAPHIFKPTKLESSVKDNGDSFILTKNKFRVFNNIY